MNNVVLIGSSNDARSLAAVVGRCPALGVTVKALLGEFPQVLFFDWHWRTTRHTENMCFLINPHSIAEELTCKSKIAANKYNQLTSLARETRD